ncbi:MFS transporter small subunit [Nocardiopsis aegyptia]|uniref:Uncharacterized protein n=1 Tax=Nocardiopsis aegyptia TaxID=220378 RepID=A0A7Z0JD52_9ACTN|nr:hypothetical protein [Nocardiopsis aegyptia]NYJ37667.1 hypothetical protein [Nocardiopsis aegyptia]
MPNPRTKNATVLTAILLWVVVLAALAYGVARTAVDAAALFTA